MRYPVTKSLFIITSAVFALTTTQSAFAFEKSNNPNFKRFSVSAGLLHATPTGSANPLQNTTVIDPAESYANGVTAKADLLPTITDEYKTVANTIKTWMPSTISANSAGTVQINSLEGWSSPETGLEAADANTLGILLNYHINDNWSIESKAGLPPEVSINGVGQVYSPIRGKVSPEGIGKSIGDFDIANDVPITDMTQGDGVASTARAWLPAAELHYQFGKAGENKLRPYIGAGIMYAYFDKLEMNEGIKNDLNIAGQRIQLIKQGEAGKALADQSAFSPKDNIKVEVEATDGIAPIATVGATYDINDKTFAVGSVSYAKLNNESIITVSNDEGEELIRSETPIDIDPVISYVGVGYRF